MRRVRLLAPFEAIQGNLSGRQDLRYAEHDNKAYESPAGKKNYARNYTPRYIGSYITKSGKSVFRVKTKSAVHMTPKATKAMALLGGAGAVYGALIKVKTTATYLGVLAQYNALVAIGEKRSFQQYCMDIIRQAIVAHAQNVTFAGPATLVTFKNPWYNGTMSTDVTISNAVLQKFWLQLCENAISFNVSGMKGLAKSGDSFDDVAAANYNNLGIVITTISSVQYPTINGLFIYNDAGDAVTGGSTIEVTEDYELDATTPEA